MRRVLLFLLVVFCVFGVFEYVDAATLKECESAQALCIDNAAAKCLVDVACISSETALCGGQFLKCKESVEGASSEGSSGESEKASSGTDLVNPLGGKPGSAESAKGITSVQSLVGKIIAIALGFLGSLALLFFIYGGFLWMTSRGKPEIITKGTKTMLWAAIGIFFVFSSYSILIFILNAIGAKV